MNLNTLKEFRQHVYTCLEQRADALFSLCDGLLSEGQARSLPERSHSPFFDRPWPSLYAALADGKINFERLRAACARSVLAERPEDAAVWIAVDGPQSRAQKHKPVRIAATFTSRSCPRLTSPSVLAGGSRW